MAAIVELGQAPEAFSEKPIPSYLQHLYYRQIAVIIGCAFAALMIISGASWWVFNNEFVPATEQKASTVGLTFRSLILRADEVGYPFDEIKGIEAHMKHLLRDYKEFSYIAVTNTSGEILYAAGRKPAGALEYFGSVESRYKDEPVAGGDFRTRRVDDLYMVTLPINNPERALGALHIGIDSNFVLRSAIDVVVSVAVVLIGCLFFALEILRSVAGANVSEGLAIFSNLVHRTSRGDLHVAHVRRQDDEIGRLIGRLDGILARINGRFDELVEDMKEKTRNSLISTQDAYIQVGNQLQAIRDRYALGTSTDADAGVVAQLNRLRFPFFFFILSEEMTRSFLPGWTAQIIAREFGTNSVAALALNPPLKAALMIGLPIMLFMAIVAIGAPRFAIVSRKLGRGTTMMMGALIVSAGFLLAGTTEQYHWLLISRAICAVGYAMVFISVQGIVLENANGEKIDIRFAFFLAAISVAMACGAAFGGILADVMGPKAAFFISAAFAFTSIAFMAMSVRDMPLDEQNSRSTVRFRDAARLFANRRFMIMSFTAAVPAKAILGAICFFLMPLYVISQAAPVQTASLEPASVIMANVEGGELSNEPLAAKRGLGHIDAIKGENNSQGISRLLIIYAMITAAAELMRGVFQKMTWPTWKFVSVGLVISGLGPLIFCFWPGMPTLYFAIVCLGAGQVMSVAKQSELVTQICGAEIAAVGADMVYGIYRMLERLGHVIGIGFAAVILVNWGYAAAFGVLAMATIVAGMVFGGWAERHRVEGVPA